MTSTTSPQSAPGGSLDALLDRVARLQEVSGLTASRGPGVRVTLTDAPRSVDVPGLDPNVLVVHQQDIQAFVNALWTGGAEAISLQGQRLISTTGIKCVGNTVVLDGVPYSPPYVIEAIGDPARLNSALDASPEVVTYRDYVTAGTSSASRSRRSPTSTMKAYAGTGRPAPMPGADRRRGLTYGARRVGTALAAAIDESAVAVARDRWTP